MNAEELHEAARRLNERAGAVGPITDPEILAEVARILTSAKRGAQHAAV